MLRSRNTRSSGFSLIELMIGIVIMAIALAVGMPSYSQWIQNTQIRTAAESILNGMQRARAEAVNRNTNVSFTFGGGSFWTVSQVNPASVIEARPVGEMSPTITRTILPVATPPAVAPSTITFSALGGVVANADGTLSITQVDVDSSALSAGDSRNLRILIGVGGAARMCDPTVSSTTDPRICP